MIYHRVAIYLRGEQLFIAPCCGSGGVFYETEPVFAVPPTQGALAPTLLWALASSVIPSPCVDLRKLKKSPMLAMAGVRSYRQFYQGVAYCTLDEGDDGFQIQPWRPAKDNRGFEPYGASYQLPATTRIEQVAEHVLQILRRASGAKST